jgi:ABC-2 type transport system ATP-binding protein
MSEAIVARNVTKKFGNLYRSSPRRISDASPVGYPLIGGLQPELSALEDVTFQVGTGEIFGMVGPHGSGKTTLIHLLGGLLPPDRGTIHIFGYDIARQPGQAHAMTNRISGQASFFQRLSAVENLVYGIKQAGLNNLTARERAADLLVQLGVQPHEMNLPLVSLPRAAYQKVALASALLPQPRLLLLDEPFKEMDRSGRQSAERLLKKLSECDGVTILFATRDLPEARLFCNRLAQLEKGCIIGEEGPEIRSSRQSSLPSRLDQSNAFQDSIPRNEIWQEECV